MLFGCFSLRNSRRESSESGAALIEFVIASIILFPLFLGVADLGGMLNSYMVLSQVAGEGVRSASERPGLEEGAYLSSQTSPSGHLDVQGRIGNLLRAQSLKVNNLVVASAYQSGVDADGKASKTVSVRIFGDYHGFLPVFKNFQISAQKRGPYLF